MSQEGCEHVWQNINGTTRKCIQCGEKETFAGSRKLDVRAEGIYAKWIRYPEGSKSKDSGTDLFQIERVNGDQSVSVFTLTREEFNELLQGMNFLKTSRAK